MTDLDNPAARLFLRLAPLDVGLFAALDDAGCRRHAARRSASSRPAAVCGSPVCDYWFVAAMTSDRFVRPASIFSMPSCLSVIMLAV